MRSTQRVRQRSARQALAKRNLTNTETSLPSQPRGLALVPRCTHIDGAARTHVPTKPNTIPPESVGPRYAKPTNTSQATRSSHTATPVIRNDSLEHLRGCRRRRTLKRSPIIRQKGKGSPALHIHLSETAQTKSDAWLTPRWTPLGRHHTWQTEMIVYLTASRVHVQSH